jgi:bifunctional DNase/RNase
MNNKKSPRPLTHDLIKSILKSFEAELVKVLIYDMINDVFYSELHIMQGEKLLIVDARTSDAVALAVRTDCPIYIKSEILDIVGTEVELTSEEVNKESPNEDGENLSDEDLDLLSLDKLEEMLELAVKTEKYELAVTLRDAIKRNKKVNR